MANSKTKRECPITKEQFNDYAKEIVLKVAGQTVDREAKPKEFSSGSIGWYCSGKVKVTMDIDGEEVEVDVQVGCNLTIIGSKALANGDD